MSDATDTISAYRWVLAWAVLFVILWLFSKLAIGYTILYYLAVLVILLLLVTQYQAIASMLSPFQSRQEAS